MAGVYLSRATSTTQASTCTASASGSTTTSGTEDATATTDEGHDRNLYIDQVTFNGIVNDLDAAIGANTTSYWDFNL